MCLLFIRGSVSSAAEKDKRHEKYIESLLKYKPASYYKMEINPITPSAGITTGHVIAYGHYIKPPYKVEVRDTCVFINNVQVLPILETKGMKDDYKKAISRRTKEENERTKVIHQSKKLYDSLVVGNNSSLEAISKIVSYLKGQKYFSDSIIAYDEHTIRYIDKKNKIKGMLTFHPKTQSKSSNIELTSHEKAKQFEGSYIESLNSGWLELVSPPGSFGSIYGDKIKNIKEILFNMNLSRKEKIDQLLIIVYSDAHALMLLNNFNISEWETIDL
jgi:hypothetical protein